MHTATPGPQRLVPTATPAQSTVSVSSCRAKPPAGNHCKQLISTAMPAPLLACQQVHGRRLERAMALAVVALVNSQKPSSLQLLPHMVERHAQLQTTQHA